VTTVARTLLDVAAVVRRGEVFKAFREAEAASLLTAAELAEALRRRPGRRGNVAIRAVLDWTGYGSGVTRSTLEARFGVFLQRHGLPPPQRNVHMRAGALEIEADCVWRDAQLIVELDGRAYHDTATAFEADRARDIGLAADGWTVIRVTWRHLRDGPEQLARDIRAILDRPPPRVGR
jgi:Protein of unknown function (DUF559)